MPNQLGLHLGTQFMTFEKAQLAVDFVPASGPATRQLLLLVNGYSRTRGDFRAFRKRLGALAPDVATLSLDNRASGETHNELETFDVAQMARDARFVAQIFAQKLDLPSFAALGVSMGGMICQRLAFDMEQDAERGLPLAKLSHLVLVSTTGGGKSRTWPGGREPALVYKPWPRDEPTMRARMEKYFGPRFRKSSPLLIEMMIKNMLKATGDVQADARSGAQFTASASFDGTGFLEQIRAPTLLVTGTEDAIIPAENARTLVASLRDARLLEYPEVGHLILIEEPEKFVADVCTFLHESVEETNPWN